MGIFLFRASNSSDAYAVTTRVQCGDWRIVDRVVAVELPRRAACKISLFVPSPNGKVNIVIPYSNRIQSLRECIERAATLLSGGANLKLFVGARGKGLAFAQHLASEMNLQDSVAVIAVCADACGNFSRAVALRDSIRTVPPNETVFVMDAVMRVSSELLRT